MLPSLVPLFLFSMVAPIHSIPTPPPPFTHLVPPPDCVALLHSRFSLVDRTELPLIPVQTIKPLQQTTTCGGCIDYRRVRQPCLPTMAFFSSHRARFCTLAATPPLTTTPYNLQTRNIFLCARLPPLPSCAVYILPYVSSLHSLINLNLSGGDMGDPSFLIAFVWTPRSLLKEDGQALSYGMAACICVNSFLGRTSILVCTTFPHAITVDMVYSL